MWIEEIQKNFTSGRWLTLKQINRLGGHVKKGEIGTIVFYFINVGGKVNKEDSNEAKWFPAIKYYMVFNLDQIEGIDFDRPKENKGIGDFNPIDIYETLISSSGVPVNESGIIAAYNPTEDIIQMPNRQRYHSVYDFYATAAHELVHSTMHEARCNRKHRYKKNPERSYAFEELVAEIGSRFLMCRLGNLEGDVQNHAAYIASWLELLKNHKQAIFKAAAQAQKAADYLYSEVSSRML